MTDIPESLRDGRYRGLKVLGSGSQATTFEATDVKVGRLVAIKRFTVRGATSWKEVELAEREAKVLAELSHPLIPSYVEHFEENGALYLVTEKIEGESLAALRTRGGRLGRDEVMRMLQDVGAVLTYLHRRAPPIIHRDVKPGNVLRRSDGRFALVDFGAVRDHLRPEGGSTVVGTFGYMAPEQFQGRALAASDVYGAAATALTLLTGVEPEKLPHRGLAIDVYAALGARKGEPLADLLTQMLEPDPERRLTRVEVPGERRRRSPDAEGQRREWDARREADSGDRGRSRDRADRRAERKIGRSEARAEKRARRERRHREAWQRRARSMGAIQRAFVNLGLVVASVAVNLSCRVIVPVVLNVLSIVFGKALRRAAVVVASAGARASRSIEDVRSEIVDLRLPDEDLDLDAESTREAPLRPGDPIRVRLKEERLFEEFSDAEREAEAEREADAEERRRRDRLRR